MTAPGCLDPTNCPVPSPTPELLRSIRTHPVEAGEEFFTAFHTGHPGIFNDSGRGDTRFAPVGDRAGVSVPTLYGSGSQTAALLETIFHDVHASVTPRLITKLSLSRRGLARLTFPGRVTLIDLRSPALLEMGIPESQLTTTAAAHYPCTREWASALLDRGVGQTRPVGIVWQSRVAGLARSDSPLFEDLLWGPTAEVFILFGRTRADTAPGRVPIDQAVWSPDIQFNDLSAPDAIGIVAAVAAQIDAVLV